MSGGRRARLLLACLLGLACSDAPKTPPNVLLISVDTLRPDRLGFGGSARPTSPALDQLAAQGVVFPNAWSASGWTLPSMASILSGRYPKDHGAVDFQSSLRAGLPTLATMLAQRGYDTRGYVSHLVLVPQYGVAQGFARFDDSVLAVGHPHLASTDRQLTDRVIAGLGDLRPPYLLWVHYFGPHFDYLWHEGWESFGRSASDRYDQEIAFTDSHIGRLLDELARRGLADNTITVFTADHGEEFGEHGGAYHYTLHPEVLHVPLVIRAPGLAPRRETARVEQVDLLPTILGLLGIAPDPGAALAGRDVLASPPAAASRPAFYERERPPPWRQRAIVEDRYKLVVVEELPQTAPLTPGDVHSVVENVHPGVYLYDLEADPGETRNLFREGDPRAIELLAKLTEHFADAKPRPADDKLAIDEDLREKLKQLGYAP